MNSTRRAKYRRMGVDRSSLGEVEAAYSSSALMGKVMYEKSVSLKEFRNDELLWENRMIRCSIVEPGLTWLMR